MAVSDYIRYGDWTFETTCCTTSSAKAKDETQEEMKARHERELKEAKESAEKKKQEEIERKENAIFETIKRDSVLRSIKESMGNTFIKTSLKKAYNERLDEIAEVMMKLKK